MPAAATCRSRRTSSHTRLGGGGGGWFARGRIPSNNCGRTTDRETGLRRQGWKTFHNILQKGSVSWVTKVNRRSAVGSRRTKQRSRPSRKQLVKHELQHLRAHWWWLLALGVLLVACGTTAIAFPVITTLAVVNVLVVILMVAGIATIIGAPSGPASGADSSFTCSSDSSTWPPAWLFPNNPRTKRCDCSPSSPPCCSW